MSLCGKNMSWAPWWSHTRLGPGLMLEGYLGWIRGLKASQWGTAEHPHTSHQPHCPRKSDPLRRLGCSQRHSGEGQRAFTAASTGRGGPVCLFCLCMNWKFWLKVNKQVIKTLIKLYLEINFHTPKNANEEKREHDLHV